MLDLAGFVKPVTDAATGIVTSFEQPASAIWGLRLVIMVPILLFLTFAYIASKKLKLNPRRSVLVGRIIADRSVVETLDEDDIAELERIKQELF